MNTVAAPPADYAFGARALGVRAHRRRRVRHASSACSPPPPPPPPPRVAIDSTIVNVALPNIQGNVGASRDEGAFIVTGYIVANVIVIPLSPWLQRRFGCRQYFLRLDRSSLRPPPIDVRPLPRPVFARVLARRSGHRTAADCFRRRKRFCARAIPKFRNKEWHRASLLLARL